MASTDQQHFHLVDGTANKFWSVWTVDAALHTHYGRIGTAGKTTVKVLVSDAAAQAAMAKLIDEKTGKGYVLVSAAEAVSAPKKAIARAEIPPPPATMDEAGFWNILDRLDWKKSGDDDRVLAPAVAALAKMSVDDIVAFQTMLTAKLYALDTREHARAVYKGEVDPDDGNAYISADDFLYSRCVMLVNGRERYEAVLADPTLMVQGSEFESVLYLATTAYEKKTGGEFESDSELSYESFSNKDGWKPGPNTKPGRATENVPPMNRRPT